MRPYISGYTDILHSGEDLEGSTTQFEGGFVGLYPLETHAHAISLRFKYHFETERETNRLDKACFSTLMSSMPAFIACNSQNGISLT